MSITKNKKILATDFTPENLGCEPAFDLLSTSKGGTGTTSFEKYSILSGNGTSSFQTISPSTAGYVLTSNGNSNFPSFQPISTNTQGDLEYRYVLALDISAAAGSYNGLTYYYTIDLPQPIKMSDYKAIKFIMTGYGGYVKSGASIYNSSTMTLARVSPYIKNYRRGSATATLRSEYLPGDYIEITNTWGNSNTGFNYQYQESGVMFPKMATEYWYSYVNGYKAGTLLNQSKNGNRQLFSSASGLYGVPYLNDNSEITGFEYELGGNYTTSYGSTNALYIPYIDLTI